MALYFGSSGKQKISINNSFVHVYVGSIVPTTNVDRLLSYDGYTLTDCQGVCLVPKDDQTDINYVNLMSFDSHILKDVNELYLMTKEDK